MLFVQDKTCFIKHPAPISVTWGHTVMIMKWSTLMLLENCLTQRICIRNMNAVPCIDQKLQAQLKFVNKWTDQKLYDPGHWIQGQNSSHQITQYNKSTSSIDKSSKTTNFKLYINLWLLAHSLELLIHTSLAWIIEILCHL